MENQDDAYLYSTGKTFNNSIFEVSSVYNSYDSLQLQSTLVNQ